MVQYHIILLNPRPKLASSTIPHLPLADMFFPPPTATTTWNPDHRAMVLLHMIIIIFSPSPVEHGFSIMNLYFIILVDHFH